MNVFVAQYQYSEWESTQWKFAGVFSTQELAMQFCEKRVNDATWRDSEVGEWRGAHMEGRRKLDDELIRMCVINVEIDDLVGQGV